MANYSTYFKYCIVPLCISTTVKTPDKMFIRLPEDWIRRAKWLKACRRNEKDISQKSKALHVCEDHFNLEEDMDNYIKFKLMGGQKKLKPNVVPHIFDCQPDRKRSFTQPPRPAAIKRVKRRILDDAMASTSTSCIGDLNSIQLDSSSDSGVQLTQPSSNSMKTLAIAVEKTDVSTQTRPKVRSKNIQCELHCGVTIGLLPLKILRADVGTTPTKPIFQASASVESVCESSTSEESGEDDTYSLSDYSVSCQEAEDLDKEAKKQIQSLFLKCTIKKLQRRPRLYMRLPDYAYYTFQLLEKYCKIESKNIFLTLKKIRTGQSFIILADDFGTSEGNASKIFSKSLPVISKFLRKCILTPPINNVKLNLPLAFRGRFSKVLCIIDCLEIQIEKPSDSVKQSLSWSDYKKCNTLKYLISCTPDGIINFISTGFGGRTSDAIIVEHSGFLDVLPPNVAIMADRGFKHIEHLLVSKNCVLIRPPSVSASIKSSKTEVLETKRIASLRIHVERVIGRLREFSCLAPHDCIDNKLIPYTDHITKIACGLINLQSGVISGR